jgi:hypothetical protein
MFEQFQMEYCNAYATVGRTEEWQYCNPWLSNACVAETRALHSGCSGSVPTVFIIMAMNKRVS